MNWHPRRISLPMLARSGTNQRSARSEVAAFVTSSMLMMSSLLASAVTLYAKSFQNGSPLACGLVSFAVQVQSCPRVLSSFCPEPPLRSHCKFHHAQCCNQIVDSEREWIPPKHEFASHGFSVSSDAVMVKRLREQVSAVITDFYFVILQLT